MPSVRSERAQVGELQSHMQTCDTIMDSPWHFWQISVPDTETGFSLNPQPPHRY